MNSAPQPPSARDTNLTGKVFLFATGVLIFLVALVYRWNISSPTSQTIPNSPTASGTNLPPPLGNVSFRASAPLSRSPEQIVADKVVQFGKQRRQIVQRLAMHHSRAIPLEVEQFFDAVEAGNWPEIERLFGQMAPRSGRFEGPERADPELNPFWPAVLETYGVAQQAHQLPAAELLRFGQDVLSTLPAGGVYIGGTDAGRFVPTLLAATSSGEQTMVLTQNAFADSTYLEYLQFLYGDRLNIPSQEDSQRIFADYVADASKRLEHDKNFPDEPKQIRHLENVTQKDNKIEVGGPTAVMDINERLLQLLLEKNPDLRFTLQESFPLKNTYATAVPSGPIMELRARDASEPLPDTAATQSLDYWRSTAAQITPATHSDESRKNYSHMAGAQGNLLAHHGHNAAAEQTYQLSLQMYPGNVDTLVNYHQFLRGNNRSKEAEQLLQRFKADHPSLMDQVNKWLPPQ